jgi:hypothetical protein
MPLNNFLGSSHINPVVFLLFINLCFQISPADIRWDGAPPEGFGQGFGNGIKNSVGYGGISHSNKGRAVLKGQSIIDSAPSQNGIGRRDPEDIELRYTDKLIMKVNMNLFTREFDMVVLFFGCFFYLNCLFMYIIGGPDFA